MLELFRFKTNHCMNKLTSKLRGGRGFTLAEILIYLLIAGALAGAVIYTITRINQGASDTKKTENAKEMTRVAVAVWQANIDISGWTDTTTAIAGLKAGVTIPAPVEGGQSMPLKIENDPNPAAYTYTAPVAATNTGPRFDAVLGHPEVRP